MQAAGYQVGFHFDPLIAHDGWEAGYRDTIDAVFRHLDTRRVAWVSLGSLRMTAGLKAAIKARPQHATILDSELVPGPDGKERVWRGLRVKMYRQMLQWLRDVDAPHAVVHLHGAGGGVGEGVRRSAVRSRGGAAVGGGARMKAARRSPNGNRRATRRPRRERHAADARRPRSASSTPASAVSPSCTA